MPLRRERISERQLSGGELLGRCRARDERGGAEPDSLTIVAVSPTADSTGVNLASIVTASIAGYIDYPSVNASTFQLRDPAGNIVPALVGGGGETQTFTLQPTSPLAYQTKCTATVRGGPTGIQPRSTLGTFMGADYTWSFTTAAAPATPPPVQCPCTIWNGASTTAAGPEFDFTPVELGVRFRSDVDGFISGVRFYKHSANTGTHIGNLWSNTGALLASATFINESTSGWQQVVFSTPVAIKANTTYVASYHTNTGNYAANGGYFARAVRQRAAARAGRRRRRIERRVSLRRRELVPDRQLSLDQLLGGRRLRARGQRSHRQPSRRVSR